MEVIKEGRTTIFKCGKPDKKTRKKKELEKEELFSEEKEKDFTEEVNENGE